MNRPGRLALQIAWRFRFDLLAVAVLAVVMASVVDYVPVQSISALIPLMGIVAAIFIGFRNRNAYNRWWEARTLWTAVLSNGRSLHYALMSYDDGTPEIAGVAARMRRREVRHARTLAAELHHSPAPPRLAELTPEDPPDCTATELLRLQATDIGELSRSGAIDRQARRVLTMINSAQVNAAGGLERISSQPVPRFYAFFTRAVAWIFAIVVCTGLSAGGHDSPVGIVLSILIMTVVVIAERVGSLLDEPMSNDAFGLPLDLYCTTLATDLLGSPGAFAANQAEPQIDR